MVFKRFLSKLLNVDNRRMKRELEGNFRMTEICFVQYPNYSAIWNSYGEIFYSQEGLDGFAELANLMYKVPESAVSTKAYSGGTDALCLSLDKLTSADKVASWKLVSRMRKSRSNFDPFKVSETDRSTFSF